VRYDRRSWIVAVCYDVEIMLPCASPPSELASSEQLHPLNVRILGRMDYSEALAEQHDMHARRLHDDEFDTLLLVEHPPVYTLGRNSDPRHILVSDEHIRSIGATIARNERGGEVTYHGPGQLVAYPIIFLRPHERSITFLVQRMEATIVKTLEEFGIAGEAVTGDHGVWVDGRKIASIGMAVRRWVVLHGMALNVTTDLQYFSNINPCGHPNMRMTSMSMELGYALDWQYVALRFATHFARVFGRETLSP
jgi:lipoate-protein ligase B